MSCKWSTSMRFQSSLTNTQWYQTRYFRNHGMPIQYVYASALLPDTFFESTGWGRDYMCHLFVNPVGVNYQFLLCKVSKIVPPPCVLFSKGFFVLAALSHFPQNKTWIRGRNAAPVIALVWPGFIIFFLLCHQPERSSRRWQPISSPGGRRLYLRFLTFASSVSSVAEGRQKWNKRDIKRMLSMSLRLNHGLRPRKYIEKRCWRDTRQFSPFKMSLKFFQIWQ